MGGIDIMYIIFYLLEQGKQQTSKTKLDEGGGFIPYIVDLYTV